MNLSVYIARRYLFSKKSHNAIHIISMVAICGITIATMAMVCTLSIFNGFQGLVSDMFSSFDPELKITPVEGKVFDPTTEAFRELRTWPEIALVSESLEDHILVGYQGWQVPATVKGVSDNFGELTNIQSILIDGDFQLHDDENNYAVIGVGLANRIGIHAGFIYPMELYAPKRTAPVNLANPAASFAKQYAYIAGVFIVNQPVYDENYLIVPLSLTRELFEYTDQVSSLEIKVKDGVSIPDLQKRIVQLIGNNYEVKDRYQQQESSFRMISIEKWVTFLMLCFILLIAAFNAIGSLSMLIVDKQKDIVTLQNLGADNRLISRIFLFEGWMISIVGATTGIILGVLLCWGQQQFGWLKLGTQGAFAVDAYPVRIAAGDLLLTLLAVLSIGFVSVAYPVRYLSKKWIKT
jgi:lipoprotein-releasing system permease protein/zinc transport system substrate-binding protein